MNQRSTQDTATLLLITIVGLFVAGSMIALVALAFAGVQGGESVWAGLFSLCTAILGAVGGYLGGTAVAARRQNGSDAAPPEPPDPFELPEEPRP